jgi:hypothetical protein
LIPLEGEFMIRKSELLVIIKKKIKKVEKLICGQKFLLPFINMNIPVCPCHSGIYKT